MDHHLAKENETLAELGSWWKTRKITLETLECLAVETDAAGRQSCLNRLQVYCREDPEYPRWAFAAQQYRLTNHRHVAEIQAFEPQLEW